MITAMTRIRTVHACTDCGTGHAEVDGPVRRVRGVEHARRGAAAGRPRRLAPAPLAMAEVSLLHDIDALLAAPQPTGIAELDRVLGGGIVPGSVTLLGGEPGIGKSTLLLQLLAWWPGTALYVSAEESAQQVRLRAERLAAVRPDLWLANETTLAGVVDAIDRTRPVARRRRQHPDHRRPAARLVAGLGRPGARVRPAARRRGQAARRARSCMVGHVTKDGALAGPRVLEHVVDTVLSFEGERHHALRLLRAVKHRFGSTDELGLFEMTGTGLQGVPDPSKLFLADRRAAVAGSVVVPAMEGQRPLLVEVQALTVPVPPGVPARRNAQGLDGGRLSLLLAVLERRAGLRVADQDVYASTVGGVRLVEPGIDLAVTVAVASAVVERPVGADDVVHRRGRPRRRGAPGRPRPPPARRGGADRLPPGDRAGVVAAVRRHRAGARAHRRRGAGGRRHRPAVARRRSAAESRLT